MDATITLHKYLNKQKIFIIPDYQRGYIWGKKKANAKDTDSVTYILNTILSKYQSNTPIFLQGVTVTETKDTIVLIDGQQRTTFIYILLKFLDYKGYFEIKYDVRDESGSYLKELNTHSDIVDNPNEKYQDIYYFNKTWLTIKTMLGNAGITSDKYSELINYLLHEIKFLYINIPEPQARKVFNMMNGNRAKMLEQEIIKAELLRLASLPFDKDSRSATNHSIEWELNMLRSRYAREWDKWIHWWNRKDVQEVFNTDEQLGWLLISIMPKKYNSGVTFESFCKEILKSNHSMQKAKMAFDCIRRVQKRFEDAFNNPIIHNKIGAILRIINDPVAFMKYYFVNGNIDNATLHNYYLCAFLDMTHDMITSIRNNFNKYFIEKYNQKLNELKLPKLYEDNPECAFRLLLRLNIDEDNLQNNGLGRKFDFNIWKKNVRSLEHIFPKSKVYNQDDGIWKRGDGKEEEPCDNDSSIMKRADIKSVSNPVSIIGESILKEDDTPLRVTEHSIGNLVLLYKDDNSSFNNRDFQQKKEMFLVGENKNDKKILFKSRHLLHTIYHFSERDWGADEITKHFINTLSNFESAYTEIIQSVNNHG